jgi:hypothetical protein
MAGTSTAYWVGHGKPKSEISDVETEQSLLVATDGLNPASGGKVQVGIN